nr:scarecrow-like protein 14 [Tanacetum cinerariifolium]
MLKTIVSPKSRQLESPQLVYNKTLHNQNVKKGWCSCGCTECDDPTVPHDYYEAVLDYIKDMLMGEEDDLMNKSSMGKNNRQPLECGGFEEHRRGNKQLAGGRGEETMEDDIVTKIDILLLCPGSKQVGLHDELACCPFDKPTNPCAQAVSSSNKFEVEKFLKKIKSHSSPRGDSEQRLAHYFANTLEARFQGTGMDLYANLASSKINSSDIIKAYQVYVSTCPFKKMSNIYANKVIGNLARGYPKLHIIDFGILYGFQWPCLIQGLSARPSGPPSLKITGIDFPQPGFGPAERVEET